MVAPNQLTPPEALAVTVAAQAAATQQTSLAPLFADLCVAAGVNGLPAQVQQAVAQVLAQRTSLDPGLTGAGIKQAFQSSGLFLETSLASGGGVIRGAGPQGGADCAAPGADDLAQRRGADAWRIGTDDTATPAQPRHRRQRRSRERSCRTRIRPRPSGLVAARHDHGRTCHADRRLAGAGAAARARVRRA